MIPVARRGLVTIDEIPYPAVFRFIAACPGFTKLKDNGGVMFAASRAHVDRWNEMFPQFPIMDADGCIANLYAERTPIAEVPRRLDYNALSAQPAEHQTRAHNTMHCRKYFGFFHDMGTFKSSTIIQGAAELFAAGEIDRALIITTKRGLPQFMNEQIPLWVPRGISYRVEVVPSAKAKKKFLYPNGDLLIGMASPGTFQSEKQSAALIEFARAGKCAVFVDESQNFKGWSTARVDNLLKLKPHADRRFLFSGEPTPLGLEDLFAQFFFMDENVLGHASKQSFVNQYCILGGYKMKQVVDYKNQNELAALIAPHSEFLKIDDIIDMPARIYKELHYEPTEQQLELYDQLKKEFMICVEIALNSRDSETVRRTCKNAASKFTVMSQVSNGWFYKDLVPEADEREVVRITDERARFAIEEIVESTHKCILWGRYHEDLAQIERVAAEYKIEAVEFSGRVSGAQCERNKIRFQQDDKCKLFFGTAASGGEALNLQVCNHMGFFSNTFNWGHRNQGERRTWRGGQLKKCWYGDIIGLPIDRILRNNALQKEDVATQLKLATNMAKLAELL